MKYAPAQSLQERQAESKLFVKQLNHLEVWMCSKLLRRDV